MTSCTGSENSFNCALDCGACVPTGEVCDDGEDNDCDGDVDCDDLDCASDQACQPTCNNDGTCDPGEDCQNCGNDCAGRQNGRPSNRYCCGNGIEESAEGDGSICDGNY